MLIGDGCVMKCFLFLCTLSPPSLPFAFMCLAQYSLQMPVQHSAMIYEVGMQFLEPQRGASFLVFCFVLFASFLVGTLGYSQESYSNSSLYQNVTT